MQRPQPIEIKGEEGETMIHRGAGKENRVTCKSIEGWGERAKPIHTEHRTPNKLGEEGETDK